MCTLQPYFAVISRPQESLLQRLVRKIEARLMPRDLETGFIYIAKAADQQVSYVKIGYSAQETEQRIDDIENVCRQPVDRRTATGRFRGAHRAEQIIHKYLATSLHHRRRCSCQHENREWYQVEYEIALGLVSNVVSWMLLVPYDFGARDLRSNFATALAEFKDKICSDNPISAQEFFAHGSGVFNDVNHFNIVGQLSQATLSENGSGSQQSQAVDNLQSDLRAPPEARESSSQSLWSQGMRENEDEDDFDEDDHNQRWSTDSNSSDEFSESYPVSTSLHVDSDSTTSSDDSDEHETFSTEGVAFNHEKLTAEVADLERDEAAFEDAFGANVSMLQEIKRQLNPATFYRIRELELYNACQGGHINRVNDLIDYGVNVNASGGFYGNPLQAASQRAHHEIVQSLIDEDAELNQIGGLYGTALQAASARGHEGLVRLLLLHGAAVNIRAGQFDNALYAAAYHRNDEVMRFLITKGANTVALSLACKDGEENMIRSLLRAGSNPNIRSKDEEPPLSIAAACGHDMILKALLQYGADINIKCNAGNSALYVACDNGHRKAVRLLLKNNADPNVATGRHVNRYPLAIAARRGHLSVVQTLLRRGAEDKGSCLSSTSPICEAARQGHHEIVQLLLEKTAPSIMNTILVNTALRMASRRGFTHTVRILLHHGASAHDSGGYGGNALYMAAVNGHEDVVKLLIKKGAQVNHLHGSYGTVLAAASVKGHVGVVRRLLKLGADVNACASRTNAPLYAAAEKGQLETARILLEAGADRATLCFAALHGKEGITACLLKAGVNPDTRNEDGRTALYIAASNGNVNIVRLLLKSGASINYDNRKEGNALYAAAVNNKPRTMRILTAHGADESALKLAAQDNDDGVVRLLLKMGAKGGDRLDEWREA